MKEGEVVQRFELKNKLVIGSANERREQKMPEPSKQLVENTIEKMPSISEESSTKGAFIESHGEGSPHFLESLEREELSSLSLLSSSMKQLHGAMESIVRKHEGSEVRNLSDTDVENICKLGNTVAGLMKVKVSAIKAAGQILRARK